VEERLPAARGRSRPQRAWSVECTMKKRVLVMDDEVNICRLLAALLCSAGFETATCLSGEEALELMCR
jgi:PleD family two-component response regulator